MLAVEHTRPQPTIGSGHIEVGFATVVLVAVAIRKAGAAHRRASTRHAARRPVGVRTGRCTGAAVGDGRCSAGLAAVRLLRRIGVAGSTHRSTDTGDAARGAVRVRTGEATTAAVGDAARGGGFATVVLVAVAIAEAGAAYRDAGASAQLVVPSVFVHAMPQPPQLVTLLAVLVSQPLFLLPSQSAKPAAAHRSARLDAQLVVPFVFVQAIAQPPQLATLLVGWFRNRSTCCHRSRRNRSRTPERTRC